eukprot:CAMPEP_0177678144 /NCGR_PEP_ID=MMETSP0447-20121125/28843_1 /TAXON_ID=0 /ORGANISM="Stygamoeba regulata, Strain BSH-02190019" /LENGTH=636 /DNA_ID=CAMNT_0019187109 /DNA_START=169 /DNA_END=2081 /DNA_ORIENTATION=+
MSVPLQRSLLLVVLLLILLRDLESSAEANTVASASFRFVTLLPVARADLADPAERALCEMPALHARQLSAIHHNAQAVLAYTGTPLLVVQPHVSVDEGADAESLAVRRAFAELSADLRAASDTEADEPAYPHTLLLPVRLPPSHRALACNLTHVRTHGSPSLAEQDLLLTEVLRALAQASVSELSRVNEVVLLPPGYVILHPRFFNLLRYRFVTPLAGVPLSDGRRHSTATEADTCIDFLSPQLDPEAVLYVHLGHLFQQPRRLSNRHLPPQLGGFTVLAPDAARGHIYEPLVWHWACAEQRAVTKGVVLQPLPDGDQALCYAGVLHGEVLRGATLSRLAVDGTLRDWSRELLASRLNRPSGFVRHAWEGSTVQTMVYGAGFLSGTFETLVSNHRQLAQQLHFLVHFALFSGEELSVATSRQLSELRAQGVKVRVQRMNAESCVGVVNPLHCQKKLFYNQLLASRSKLEHPTDDAADDSVIFVDADYLVLSGHLFARALLVAQGTEFLATASHVHLRCIFPKVDWNSGFFVMQRSVLSAQAIDDIQQAILKSQSGDQRGLSKYIRTHPGVMREFTSYQWHCRAYADLSSDVQTHLLQSGYCKGVHGDFKRPPSVDQGLRLLNNSVSSFAEYHVAYN